MANGLPGLPPPGFASQQRQQGLPGLPPPGFASQQRQEPTFGSEALGALGGLATGGAQMIGAGLDAGEWAANLLGGPVASLANYLYGRQAPSSPFGGTGEEMAADAQRGLETLGVQEPQTAAGRIGKRVAEFAPAAALPGGGLGARVLSSVGAGVGSGVAREFELDPLVETMMSIGGGFAPGAAGAVARKTGQVVTDAGRSLNRASIGARASDYAKTPTTRLPDGDVASYLKTTLDDLLEQGKLGTSRDPSKVIATAQGQADELSKEIGRAIQNYDMNPNAPAQPSFEKARQFLDEGGVPANLIPRYRKQLAQLEEGIASEGKGALRYLQNQKVAQGSKWTMGDSVQNEFDRKLYQDLRDSVNRFAPELGPTNKELEKFLQVEDLLKRSLSGDESSNAVKQLTQAIRTSGGFGVPVLAASYAGNPLLGLGLGALGAFSQSKTGMGMIGRGMTSGGKAMQAAAPSFSGAGAIGALANAEDPVDPLVSAMLEAIRPQEVQAMAVEAPRAPLELPELQSLQVQPQQQGGDMPAPNELIQAIIGQESSGNPKAVSKAGAQGLMQLMPATGREWHQRLGIKEPYDPFDKAQNQEIGTAYFNHLLDRYKGDERLALAAYNAGMGRVDAAIERARSRDFADISRFLPVETQKYVPGVLKRMTA